MWKPIYASNEQHFIEKDHITKKMCLWEDIFLDNFFLCSLSQTSKYPFQLSFSQIENSQTLPQLVVTNTQVACSSLFGSLQFEEWYHVQKHWWWWQNGCAKNCQTFCRHLDCNSFCCKPLIIRHQRESTLTLRTMTTAIMMEKWMISNSNSHCIQSNDNWRLLRQDPVSTLQRTGWTNHTPLLV